MVQALSDSDIPVGHLFVRKVFNACIDRQRIPFGPRKAPKGGEGPGSRTLTSNDVRWIVDLLAWNGAWVSLSIFDMSCLRRAMTTVSPPRRIRVGRIREGSR